MASLHRNRPGGNWFLWYRVNGKQICKSTRTKNRREAEVQHKALERAQDRARAGRLTAQVAQEIVSEILEAATGETLNFYTARGWVEEWLHTVKNKATRVKYNSALRPFLHSLGERAEVPLNQVTKSDLLKFQSDRARFVAASTANGDLKIVRICFNDACKQGHITFNPACAVSLLAENGVKVRKGFTADQVRAILAKAEGDWRGMVLVGFYTGARLSDAANLQWSSVDLENQWLEFTQRKTGKAVKLPFNGVLSDWFSRHEGAKTGAVFPSLAGRETGSKNGLSAQFKKIMARAGVVGGSVKNGARVVNELSYHSLRHSVSSMLADSGTPVEIRQKITGHSSVDMQLHYSGDQILGLRKAIASLPDVTKA